MKTTDWQAQAAALDLPQRMVIDGKRVDALDGERFAIIGPRDGKVVGHAPQGKARDLDVAVAAARRSFGSGIWRNVPPAVRKAVLLGLAELIDRDRAPCAPDPSA
jgi:acyl-CoA reductase-like NAD-dependent aldehyde dehydrogenase